MKSRVCLVANSGGHFRQLFELSKGWRDRALVWVTTRSPDTEYLLAESDDGDYVWAYGPTRRDVTNFFRNLILAGEILTANKPDTIVSTGAGLAPPFILMGRLLGIRTIYVESISRINSLSLSGKIVKPFVDHFIVQWPELADGSKDIQYLGNVLCK